MEPNIMTTAELTDRELDEKPLYMDSLSDNFYQTRLRGIDVGENLGKVVLKEEFTITPFDSVFAIGSKIIHHGLGYVPVMIGSYKVTATNNTTRWPIGKRGSIPESRQFAPLPSFDFFSGDIVAGDYSQIQKDRDPSKEVSVVFTRGSGGDIITLECKVLFFREHRV